jgi:glycosyltransferase involved in cell wall biosynthesis
MFPTACTVVHARTLEPFGVYSRMSGVPPEQAANPTTVLGSRDLGLTQRLARWLRANLFVPDARASAGSLLRCAKPARSSAQYNIDTVVTTGPPHSTHFIGKALKKRTGMQWIADFRDPWTDIHYNRVLPRTAFTRKLDLRMETSILTLADEVTVTAPGTARYFARKVERTYHTIPNGYDPDDFPATAPSPEVAPIPPHESMQKVPEIDSGDSRTGVEPCKPFIIRHVGSITETCLPENLLKAVKTLTHIPVRLEFVGMVHARLHALIREYGLIEIATVHPYVPHKEATMLMCQSDLNVVVVHQSEDSRILVPGKLYDYLYAGRPVMVIGPPDGDTAQIVRSCNIGKAFDYDDSAGPAEWISRLAGPADSSGSDAPSGTSGQLFQPNNYEISRFARPELTRRLVELITSAPPKKNPAQ